MPSWWVGIDWSERLQDCAIVNDTGEVIRHLRIEETREGVDEIVNALRRLSSSHHYSRKQVPVVIEDAGRLIAVELRRRGQPIVAVPPMVSARFRGRTGVAVSKADRTDAALLAHIARTHPEIRSAPKTTDAAQAVRVLAHARLDASEERRRLLAKLRSHLMIYFPAYVRAWEPYHLGLRRAEARALLALAPTPGQAAALSVRKVADVLERSGRFRLLEDTAAAVRDHLVVLDLRQPPATEAALGERALTILERLETVCRAEEHLDQRLNTAFDLHPHATVYRSFPCLGSTLGARIFAEIGDDPARFPTARHLRAYAGVSPITWESSTSRTVTYRRSANKLLRTAVHRWAFSTLTRSPGSRARYDERRAQGDRYAAALRIVGGRLLAGLHRCLATGQPYDEAAMWPGRDDTDPEKAPARL